MADIARFFRIIYRYVGQDGIMEYHQLSDNTSPELSASLLEYEQWQTKMVNAIIF